MTNAIAKRDLLGAGLGLSLAFACGAAPVSAAPAAAGPRPGPDIPHRRVKTTPLFKAPPGFPNAIAVAPEGLWIAEQKLSGAIATVYHLPEPADLSEKCWLVDWNGKILKTVTTPSRNTSGMAYGDGFIWMCANAPPEGVYQIDMDSRVIGHRQIPLGPPQDGGGCHGATWHKGKLWIVANRLRGILRVDPYSWQPEFMIPFSVARWHGIAFEGDDAIWMITGDMSRRYSEGKPGLMKFDATTGRVLETAEFVPGSADPHGLAMHDGVLISCDAGIHPDWPNNDSPFTGSIFRIEFID